MAAAWPALTDGSWQGCAGVNRKLREDVEIVTRAAAIFATATRRMSSRSPSRGGQANAVGSLAETLMLACPPGHRSPG